MNVLLMSKLVKLNRDDAYAIEEFDSWDEMIERLGDMVHFTYCVSLGEWQEMAKDGNIRIITSKEHSTEEIVQDIIDRGDEWSLQDKLNKLEEEEGVIK